MTPISILRLSDPACPPQNCYLDLSCTCASALRGADLIKRIKRTCLVGALSLTMVPAHSHSAFSNSFPLVSSFNTPTNQPVIDRSSMQDARSIPHPRPAPRDLYRLLKPVRAKDWASALSEANKAPKINTPVIQFLEWKHALDPASTRDPEHYAALLSTYATWPGLKKIRINIERDLFTQPNDLFVLDWFTQYPAISGLGKIRHGEALIANNFPEEGANAIRTGWHTATLTSREMMRLADRHQNILQREDHHIRLDRLLWKQRFNAARAMFPFVSKGWRRMADARIALNQFQGNVDWLIQQVPSSLRKHPGLQYERIRWRRHKELHDRARDMLIQMTSDTDKDWQANKIWKERRFQIREALKARQTEIAYQLAISHTATNGIAFAEGEWIAGWIALRILNRPHRAFTHFKEMWQGVHFPISRARAAYWAGRASLVLRDQDQAAYWFGLAARYHRTFYGQLAILQIQETPHVPGPVVFAYDQDTYRTLEQDIRIKAARFAHKLGLKEDSRRLIRYVDNEISDHLPEVHRALLDIAGRIDGSVSQLRMAKRAVRRNHAFDDMLYPVHPYGSDPSRASLSLPLPLVNAVIRQESLFDANVTSEAGARGLMQIMPATGRSEAKRQGLNPDTIDLLNPDINIQLGSGYLKHLIDRFDGSYILALAAYNAGQGRVKTWMKQNGDPRTTDPIDWIERIPFSETRNYVQRVLENLQIYQAWYGPSSHLRLDHDLTRGARPDVRVLYTAPPQT